jgi:DNA-directed RNA polymerase specialized sigma24 family protein
VTSDAGRAALEHTIREEAGLVLAALVASCGDFDLAEESFQDAALIALERWPREGVPDRPAAWLTTAARRRAIDRLRHGAMRAGKSTALRESELAQRAARGGQDADLEEDARARRTPAPDLHLLPSRARARGARRAHAAHARRALDRGGRALVPRARADDGEAARARQAQDPRRADPVPRAAARGVVRAPRVPCSR